MKVIATSLALALISLGADALSVRGGTQARRRLESSCLEAGVRNGEIRATHQMDDGFVCDLDSIVDKTEELMGQVSGCSNVDTRTELSILLDADDLEVAIADLCHVGMGYQPFYSLLDEGKQFDKEFYDGNTKYNTEHQTDYEFGQNAFATNNLRDSATRVSRLFRDRRSGATRTGVDWPGYTTQFENCELNAAMCCFTQDRQAGDGNGNCAQPYDENCVGA